MSGVRADFVQQAMSGAFADVRSTGLPHLFLLTGETGRGKSYALQTFYDGLAAAYPGYWQPGLRPVWPPTSTSQLRRARKQVTPPPELRRKGERVPFIWLSVSCSGSPDAPQLDPTAHILRQLQTIIGDAVEAELARSETVHWIADRVVEGIGQLAPIVSLLKYVADTAKEALLRIGSPTPSTLLSERSQAFDTLRRYAEIVRRMGLELPPVIVVIDDASAATEDLLSSISALITDPSDDGVPHDRMLPTSLERFPPLPVLFVATAWDHAISPEGTVTPFDRWLTEFEELGLNGIRTSCREFARTEAVGILDDWPYGPDAQLRDAIIDHIADANVNGLVNPLVLAEHVAWVELQRDPFQATIDVDVSAIEALSTSPHQQIVERLDLLRTGNVGRESYAILKLTSAVAITIPWGLIAQLHEESGGKASLLDLYSHLLEHRVLLPSRTADPIPETLCSMTIDADIFDYLSREGEPHPPSKVLDQAAGRLLAEWASAEADGLLRGVRLAPPQRAALMAPIALLAAAAMEVPVESSILIRAAQPDGHMPVDEWRRCDDAATRALAWLVDGGSARVPAPLLVSGIRALGISSAAVDCVKALLAGQIELNNADRRQLIDMFAGHMSLTDIQVPLIRMLVAAGKSSEARSLLPVDMFHPQAALEVATALSETISDAAAAEFLAQRTDDNGTIRRRLAQLIASSQGPEHALKVLRIEGDSWVEVNFYCELLERAGRTAERRTLLEKFARRTPGAAVALASEYEAAGQVDKARAALSPWVGSSVSAAQRLALLEWSAGNHVLGLAVLAPFGLQNRNIAPALAKMLDSIGTSGLRFKQGFGGYVEAVEPNGASVPRLPPSQREQWVTPEDVLVAFRKEPPHSSAEDFARSLTIRFGTGIRARQAVRAALLSDSDRSPFRSAVAFHYLGQSAAESEGLACTVADLAFAAQFADAPYRAAAIIALHSRSQAPAIVGRRTAVRMLQGAHSAPVTKLLELSPTEFWFALVGGARMVGTAPQTELTLWSRITSETQSVRGGIPHPALCAFIAGRFLLLERGLGDSIASRPQLIEQSMPGVGAPDIASTLSDSLDQAVLGRSFHDVTPLPYQVISQYEVLDALGQPRPHLAKQLAVELLKNPDAERALEWLPVSTVARLMFPAG